MTRRSFLGLLISCAAFVAASAAHAQTSLTIYSDGRVLERRFIDVALPAGTSTQRIPLGGLDLASIFALDSGVVVTGAIYQPAPDEAAALRRAIGRQIGFLVRSATGATETVTAEVLGVDPERFRLSDGSIVFQRPGMPKFPADLLAPEPTLQLAIRSDRARRSLGLGFFSGGASWQASYSFVLGKSTARVSGQATISAGTLRADTAEVQLLAGNVGRAAPAAKDFAGRAERVQTLAMQAANTEAVAEVHLYSLPGRLSLVPGTETSTMLFDPTTSAFERTYTVRGVIPFWGGLPQFGEETTEPVSVTYIFKRTARTEFGDRPLPGGVARIYQADASGRPQLVGESSFDHTAPGQDLRLDAGTAFDLTAKRVQSEYTTTRDRNRTVATAAYSVTVANAKDSAVTVDVLEQRGGEWSIISSSVPAEKLSSTVTRFRIRVPARGEASLTYRVRVIW